MSYIPDPIAVAIAEECEPSTVWPGRSWRGRCNKSWSTSLWRSPRRRTPTMISPRQHPKASSTLAARARARSQRRQQQVSGPSFLLPFYYDHLIQTRCKLGGPHILRAGLLATRISCFMSACNGISAPHSSLPISMSFSLQQSASIQVRISCLLFHPGCHISGSLKPRHFLTLTNKVTPTR